MTFGQFSAGGARGSFMLKLSDLRKQLLSRIPGIAESFQTGIRVAKELGNYIPVNSPRPKMPNSFKENGYESI